MSKALPNDGDKMCLVEQGDQLCTRLASDEDDENTPLDVLKAADDLRSDLLPTASRGKYQAVYDTFMEWKKKNKVNSLNEDVLLAYFGELAKKYSAASLWCNFSMLKSTLNINANVNIYNYKQLLAFLKKKASGYQAKKSSVFTAREMNTFLNDAPDDRYLVTKVVLIFGIMGACRGAELTNLTVDDVQNRGDVMIIKLRNTKNKSTRNFTVEGEFLKTVTRYQALRPANTTSNRFFVCYRNGVCTNQVIGKNKLGRMPHDIALFLKLANPETYTGHSFRRSSATLVADQGGDITEIKRLGGWKSTTVAEGYIEDSVGYKRKTGQQIGAAITSSTKHQKVQDTHEKENIQLASTSTSSIDDEGESNDSSSLKKGDKTLQFSNCSHFTINFTH